MICASLRRKGFETLTEPRIKKAGTFIKPDIIATMGTTTWVLDPIITADNADLARRASDKVVLYDVPETRRFVRDRYDLGAEETEEERLVLVEGIAISNRGAIAPNSLRVLKMYSTTRFINYIILRVLLQTWRIINIYNHRAV